MYCKRDIFQENSFEGQILFMYRTITLDTLVQVIHKLTKNQADVFKSQKEVTEVYNKGKKGTIEK